jgi:hypothetical protein
MGRLFILYIRRKEEGRLVEQNTHAITIAVSVTNAAQKIHKGNVFKAFGLNDFFVLSW